MYLVVGLGNPGSKYAATRHNVGFMAVDRIAEKLSADATREKFSGLVSKCEAPGKSGKEALVLLKPQTFMNDSGRSVQPAQTFHKVAPAAIVVLHDELDLPFGTVRLKFGGGHAGHNGLRSIMSHLGTGDFVRVRIGIGRPPPGFRGEVADFVLGGFAFEESIQLADVLSQATTAVLDVAALGVTAAMNQRNAKAPVRNAKPRA